MKAFISWTAVSVLILSMFGSAAISRTFADTEKYGYAIVVSSAMLEDSAWKAVPKVLEEKEKKDFQVKTFVWKEKTEEVLEGLREFQPRYICFTAMPREASRDFVVSVNRLTRQLDDDPYTDAIWGIVTGFEPADAVRMAQAAPMTVTRAAAGTSIPLEYFDSGIWYDEGKQNHFVEKQPGEAPQDRTDGPNDTTRAVAEAIDSAQLAVSSGHATERDWQLGYTYRNGCFRSKNGDFFGVTSSGERFPIRSERSKIWLASGNCLIGHIDGPDAMALAMIHCANIDMMVGYTVPTWFGFMGWGIQDYYLEQPGRFTLAEAFFANTQALTYELEQCVPGLSAIANSPQTQANGGKMEVSPEMGEMIQKETQKSGIKLRGLLFDQNVVALYGNPAWQNALAAQECGWEQTLTSETSGNETLWTLTVTPKRGEKSFSLINTNGSQRGGRPIFVFLPKKIGKVTIEQGSELNPVITDDFILIPQTEALKSDVPTVLRFRSL